MGRVACRKRHGVDVSKKIKEQKSDKAMVTGQPSYLQAVHGAVDPEENVAFSAFVDLEVGKERETRQDVRRVRVI